MCSNISYWKISIVVYHRQISKFSLGTFCAIIQKHAIYESILKSFLSEIYQFPEDRNKTGKINGKKFEK